MFTTGTEKIIDDGSGGELLEIAESFTIDMDHLQTQKQAIARWRDEEDARHAAKNKELDDREAVVDNRIAKFTQ